MSTEPLADPHALAVADFLTNAYGDHRDDAHPHGESCPDCSTYTDAIAERLAESYADPDPYPIADTAPDSAAERY